ncbi:MAG: phosphocholine cytidylyltransferase family protein [Myxococcales bacterium]|nr:phosphocholine cytidylyltransferase family protein [Myxococcales bacterium]MCB9626234.1 phosphocholine cytidylyltransferase family protein [Sandaracinaceae bacterium]
MAAGTGTRLRPATDRVPKCMVPVAGRPMLTWALDALHDAGIERAVIVVGYLADVIREEYGDQHKSVRVEYVENPDYATTNNLYTLYLAREHLRGDVLLLEADLVYDSGLIQALVDHPAANVAVVDRFTPALNGTCVVLSEDDSEDIARFVLGKDQGAGFDRGTALKTVNLYKLAGTLLVDSYLPAVERWVATQRTDQYYEAVLAELVNSGAASMSALRTGSHRWYEIDTLEDLALAEDLFR